MKQKTEQQSEELKQNDHKVLGKQMGLFTFSDTVGKGLPLFTPKGATIRRELERFIVDEELKRGYLHVYTPDIAKLDLYKKSGHYPYYKESMYAPIVIDDEEFMLRPMTCPHHFELYLTEPHSYREMPMRFAELAKLYRYEQSGELMGLQRVRTFCLADAHIICRKEQGEKEINGVLDLIDFICKTLGLTLGTDYHYRLSLGDRKDDKKYFKDDAAWDHAEDVLRSVLTKRGTKFVEAENEAAFYGPKIDIQMTNANGKEDTAFTVQYDFVMPKRFKLTYVNEKGEEEEPIVVHRSSIGAIERIIAFLLEHYAGKFPVWLSPVQLILIPIAERHVEYAKSVVAQLRSGTDQPMANAKQVHQGGPLRVEIDDRNERMQAKIREATLQKIPYIGIIGDKEIDAKTISIRTRDGEDLGTLPISQFIDRITNEIEKKL
ncbi:MAG: threonine--tRNA ligase [Candidatus Roizmanbacteria bacterium]|nr:threonine--tRNA ligase [Candidatus Roizmanbacteria bacterium]